MREKRSESVFPVFFSCIYCSLCYNCSKTNYSKKNKRRIKWLRKLNFQGSFCWLIMPCVNHCAESWDCLSVYFCLVKAKGADGVVYNIKRDVNLLRGYTEEQNSNY